MRSVLCLNSGFRFLLRVLLGTAILCTAVPAVESLLRLPEFTEPIKNVTLVEGSDVEFSCDVRHLGAYRVAWSWRRGEEQRFLGIGIVKITSNPRIQISRIQKSDDTTQFNLYVYNIKKDDSGAYHCSVNSNPMIEQIGTLEVISNGYHDKDRKVEVHHPKNIQGINVVPSQGENTTEAEVEESSSSEDESSVKNSSSPGDIKIFQNSTLLCIDLKDVWDSARERISDFLTTVIKFSYTYWFS